jgi:ribonuclease-3
MESSAQSPNTSIDRHPSLDPSSPDPSPVDQLEAVLDHHFARPDLLQRALTHSSLAHERGAAESQREDNETLEFLGDAVVGLVAAEYVYRAYPELSEGALTRLRGALVSRRHLASVAEGLHLGSFLLLGRGEERSGGRTKAALLANTMEALIGAVYLDAGLDTVRTFIEARVIAPVVGGLCQQLTASGDMGDFKSALQELLQSRKQGQPDYRTIGETGPDHRKRFFVEVRVGGEALAEGEGQTRKHAEQDAARRAVDKLRAANPGQPE